MGDREQRLEAAGYPLDRGPKESPVIDLVSVLGDAVYASGPDVISAGTFNPISEDDSTHTAPAQPKSGMRKGVSHAVVRFGTLKGESA